MRLEGTGRWWRSLVACLGVSLALALMLGPGRFHARMAQRLTEQEEIQRSLQQEAAALAEAARARAAFSPALEALARQGLLGAPARLSWLEALKAAGPALALRDLQWSFGPTAAVAAAGGVSVPGFEVLAAPVSLRFGAANLAAAGGFLNWLARHAAGVFAVRECQLQAMSGTAGVAARCESQWLTVQPVQQQEQAR